MKKILFVFLLMFAAAAAAEEFDEGALKKLFTDKKERDYIDAMRAGKNVDKRASSRVKVNGYMTRSDGSSVVWVNNGSTLESSRVGDVRVHPSSIGRNKSVVVSSGGKSKKLKPGETWDKQADRVIDAH